MIIKIPKNKLNGAGIYIITNIVNGKFYIGSSKHLYKRIMWHSSKLSRNKHNNTRLQNGYNKYKSESFEVSLLEEVYDLTQLFVREQYWIDLLHPWYNLLRIAGEARVVYRQHKTKEEISKNHCLACHSAKLEESQVIEIINLLNGGEKVSSIMTLYNISDHSVTDIKNGKSYKHLKHLLNPNNKLDWSPLGDKDVLDIITRLNNKESIKDIAKIYNVSDNCIRYIKKKKRWKQYSHLIID